MFDPKKKLSEIDGGSVGKVGGGPRKLSKEVLDSLEGVWVDQQKVDFGGLGAIDGDGLGPRIHQNQPKPQKTPESTNGQKKYLRAEPRIASS